MGPVALTLAASFDLDYGIPLESPEPGFARAPAAMGIPAGSVTPG